MQFTSKYSIGSTTKKIVFDFWKKISINSTEQFNNVFQKLGARPSFEPEVWYFPIFVSNETISEIIKNTCFKCGGLMINSTGFQNRLVFFDDFGNDKGQRGSTGSYCGPAEQKKVRKCNACGHSHT